VLFRLTVKIFSLPHLDYREFSGIFNQRFLIKNLPWYQSTIYVNWQKNEFTRRGEWGSRPVFYLSIGNREENKCAPTSEYTRLIPKNHIRDSTLLTPSPPESDAGLFISTSFSGGKTIQLNV